MVKSRHWLVGLMLFCLSQVLGYLFPGFSKVILGFDVEEYANDLALRLDSKAGQITSSEVHAWIFTLILVVWIMYWAWPYRKVELKWPRRKPVPAPVERTPMPERVQAILDKGALEGGLSDAALAALGVRAKQNREVLHRAQPPKPRYALPPEAETFPVGSLSFQDLGDKLIKLSKDIKGFLGSRMGHFTDNEMLHDFMATYAPRFFWLYGEAQNRGLHDGFLDRVYKNPQGEIFNSGHMYEIGNVLERFGAMTKIYS